MERVDFEKIRQAAISSLKKPGGKKEPLPKKESEKHPTLYVFRHTQTYDNIRRIFSGRRNSLLTAEGIRQAKELAGKLKDKRIDLAIFSDIAPGPDRAEDTLAMVLKYHPDAEIEPHPLLYERDYGRLTGKSKLKLMKENFKKAILYRRSWDFPPPGGESMKMVWDNRLKKFCKDLEERMRREKINVAVSCTNNTMRLIRMYFEGLSIEEMLTLENPFADYAAYCLAADVAVPSRHVPSDP